jgi:hypothetical protein
MPLLIFAKMKMREIRQIMIMCPASMFAKRRIIRAKGFVKMLRISTGTMMNLIPKGTGGLNI